MTFDWKKNVLAQLAPGFQYSQIHLWIFVDATASMGDALETIKYSISELCICKDLLDIKLSVVYYRDFDIDQTGGFLISSPDATNDELQRFVSAQRPSGGGDLPEAQKSAFLLWHHRHKTLDIAAFNLVIHMTDASPHSDAISSYGLKNKGPRTNQEKEQRFIDSCQWPWAWAEVVKQVMTDTAVVTYSPKSDYNIMGPNLGGRYPTCTELIELLLVAVGHIPPPPLLEACADIAPPCDVEGHIRQLSPEVLIMLLLDVVQTCPSALATNPLFGKVYRETIKLKYDPMHADQVMQMMNEMSRYVDCHPENNKLKEWLRNSYDASAEIAGLKAGTWIPGGRFFFIPGEFSLSQEHALDVIRSGQSNIMICGFLDSIQNDIMTDAMPPDGLVWVPASISNDILFRLLISLACKNMYTKRGGLILAILSLRSPLLSGRAADHLRDNQDFFRFDQDSDPANCSPGLLRMMCSVHKADRADLFGTHTSDALASLEDLSLLKSNLASVVK